jgi:dipeptidyl aminopeptidase/acylaminoacyl peptidase
VTDIYTQCSIVLQDSEDESVTRRPITIEDLLRFMTVGNPEISPDGGQIVFTVRTVDTEKNRYLSHLWLADVENGSVSQFTYGEGDDGSPQWSPDGKRIAFIRTRDKRTQIWVMPSNGGEAHQLTRMEDGDPGTPVWSPDGRRIAFTFRPTHPDWTEEAGKKREERGLSSPPRVITRLHYRLDGAGFLDMCQHIWVCNTDAGKAKQITEGDYNYDSPEWSPDGKRLAFVANRSEDPEAAPYKVDIWLISPDGGELKRIPTPEGYKGNLSWSSDGRHIAYIGVETKDDPWKPRNSRLWVVTVPEGGTRCLTESFDRPVENVTVGDTSVSFEGNKSPAWSQDSQRLYFLAGDRGSTHLYSVALADGQPLALTSGAIDIGGFSLDSPGSALALVSGTTITPSELFTGRIAGNGRIQLRQLTNINGPLLEELNISQPEEITFRSFDGTELQGWLLKPPDFDPGQKYPLLLSIHGGPHLQYGNTFMHEFQVHAARGYIVLYTNPRGSMGYGEEFGACIRGNWGELDYRDIMAAADFAASLPYVVPDRMAVAGGSYGGFMTNWIVGHTDRFKCAVTDRSLSNMHSDFGTVDWPDMVDGYWEGNAWDRPEKMWQQSPLKYAANINTPLLIIHSEGDLRCPIHHAEQLFAALKYLKREVVFVRYPLETSHGLSRSGPPDLRVDRLRRIAEWLDRYLKL